MENLNSVLIEGAITNRYFNKQENGRALFRTVIQMRSDDDFVFVPCEMLGALAEKAAAQVVEGDSVRVVGKLKMVLWGDKEQLTLVAKIFDVL